MYSGSSASSLLDITKRLVKSQSLLHYENDAVEDVIEGVYTLDHQLDQMSEEGRVGSFSQGEEIGSTSLPSDHINSEISTTSIRTMLNSSQSIPANLLIPYAIENHDVKVLKFYHAQRLEKIRTSSIQDIPYSEDEWLNLSEEEKSFHRDYMDLLRTLKVECPPGVNLSASLIPPREAIVVVRVLQDVGELMTLNGFIEFRKGSQMKVKKADPTVERLIKMGAIKIVGNR
ncbi:7910_t:CDS:2 [Acaulospora morrowiae]|uniref:DNA replication complex GINS protein PSF1 n=1 Tax=Acaulospora morrowiae TaxID=94023 RepID=A0A9N8VEU2_9GLOM|nr:7910_t:CDS:2 [Acaulospora morrowiae]